MTGRQEARFVGKPRAGTQHVSEESPALFLSRSKLLRDAYGFAADPHAGQRRETDDSDFVDHPVAVARLLQRAGFGDEVVAAGLLHDTMERSGVRLEDLETRFGRLIATLVSAMTEPERPGDFRTRKAAHRMQIAGAGREAAAVFAADKIVNVQHLRQVVAWQGEERVRRRLSKPFDQKVEHYRKTLEMLDGLALPLSLTPLLREELASLEAERSRSAAPEGIAAS